MSPPNGKAGQFDKLARPAMRKGPPAPFDDPERDDILRTLRKHSPGIAREIEKLDQTFAVLLAKLEKIEQSHETIRLTPPTLLPGREPNPQEVLDAMRGMTMDQRATLLNKMKT